MIKATKIGRINPLGGRFGTTLVKRECVKCGGIFYSNRVAKYCVMHKPFLKGGNFR